jgi:quercetin dioxygenase-like cupin family protein
VRGFFALGLILERGLLSSGQMQKPIQLTDACAQLTELWSPRVVARVNDQYVKVAKVQGEFPWHAHAVEDELFLVLKGALTIGRSLADGGPLTLHAGEIFVVPKGLRHNTSAAEETWIALIETVTTRHTGSEDTILTRSLEEQLRPLAE